VRAFHKDSEVRSLEKQVPCVKGGEKKTNIVTDCVECITSQCVTGGMTSTRYKGVSSIARRVKTA